MKQFSVAPLTALLALGTFLFAPLGAQDARLSKVSVRNHTGASEFVLTGFTIGPGAAHTLLIRAVGPSLNTNDALADPVLSLYDSQNTLIDTNDNWLQQDAAAFAAVGASPFTNGSKDSAIVTTLAPGNYTALVRSRDDTSGQARIEIFDLGGTASKLINASTRLIVGTGNDSEISLVVSPGPGTRRFLLRGAGPSLATFGVGNPLPDPRLTVISSDTKALVAANENWSANGDFFSGSAEQLTRAFREVGAFAFPVGSKDAALLIDLAPGSYTIHLRSAADSQGLALIEIYDLTSGAAAPARVEPKTVSSSQPATAALPSTPPFHSADTNQDFKFSVFELTRVIELYNTRTGTTRTGRYRVQPTNSEDGFAPDPNPVDPSSTTLTSYHSADTNMDARLSLSELTRVIELYNTRNGTFRTGEFRVVAGTEDGFASSAPAIVTLASTDAAADETGSNAGEFTVTRVGNLTAELLVNYTITGTATLGTDYPALPGIVTFPAGAATVKIAVAPKPDVVGEEPETVTLTLDPAPEFVLGSQTTATVTIADSPATLYVASLRTETGVSESIASGTATLLLSASGTLASINVSFSNLSSDQVAAHLRIAPTGDYVTGLNRGRVTDATWTFAPGGNFTSADLLNALRTGNIFVGIDSSKYPTGELRGTFIQGSGSSVFIAPSAPPAVALTGITATDAARFLTQATFGPTKAEIDALTGGSIDAWITAQLALPFTAHRAATVADRTNFGGSNSFTNWNAIHMPNRQSAWFKNVLTSPDQLRQRMAYALSQILVISDISLGDDSRTEPVANYYDILGNGAFGNFRTLLEQVTLSPMMGEYLSSLRNSKATFATNGTVLTTPDENYAREVMQLFTIGLQQLLPDGTLALGTDGLPVPTYDQTTITELAKVFTGWAYPSTDLTRFRTAGANYYSPMQLFPAFHDDTVKNLDPVSLTPIPAAQGGTQDLKLALDALFNHPNTGPFISKLLIQRFTTSNPSPAYVYRVAQKFANNGSGVRGDLGAVVRAILTDYEARSPVVASNVTFGKLKEPLLRMTGLLRSLRASSESGRFIGFRHHVNGTVITSATPKPATAAEIGTYNSATLPYSAIGSIAQAALRSPTVFNFYHADYVLPGPLAAAGLVAPEFEITDDNFAISVPNYLRNFVNAVIPTSGGVPTAAAPYVLTLNLTDEIALVPNPAALIDHLNRLLCSGTLPAAAKTRITTALAALPTATTATDRAKTAIMLVLTSPAAAIQK